MPYDYDFSHYASAFDDSYAYRSFEGEYPTADAANFHYSASGVLISGYAGAYGGFAQTPYNSGPSSAGPSAAGGLANGMVDNAGIGVSTFTGAPLLHPPSYGAGASAVQNDRLDYSLTDPSFNPLQHVNSPEGSSTTSTSGESSVANWPTDDMVEQFGSSPEAQGPAFGTEQSFPPLFRSNLHAQRRRFDSLASSTASSYFTAGLQHQPASASMMRYLAPALEMSQVSTDAAYVDAHSGNSIPLDIYFFNAPAHSLATLPSSGASKNNSPQDMSPDSCRDLHMIVNPNTTQETMNVERPAGAVYPNVRKDAVLAESNAGAVHTSTAVSTAPSGSAPANIRGNGKLMISGKRRRAGPEIRDRPFKVKPISSESRYRCRFCGHPSKLLKDHKRHESRHTRTERDGWFCPGLENPCATEAESCTCPELGYTRRDLLVRHLKERKPGSSCYLAAVQMHWDPKKRGSSKVFDGYRPEQSHP
ncbi:hypothetical protein ACEPAI_6659 [Sanghuangporus weigelae]